MCEWLFLGKSPGAKKNIENWWGSSPDSPEHRMVRDLLPEAEAAEAGGGEGLQDHEVPARHLHSGLPTGGYRQCFAFMFP